MCLIIFISYWSIEHCVAIYVCCSKVAYRWIRSRFNNLYIVVVEGSLECCLLEENRADRQCWSNKTTLVRITGDRHVRTRPPVILRSIKLANATT